MSTKKTSSRKGAKPVHPLTAKIKYEMDLKGVTDEEISIVMRKDKRTFYTRKKDPSTFLLKELIAITKKLKITITIKDGEIII